jgi:glycosyltransferase involved in cell wall biosynthesis
MSPRPLIFLCPRVPHPLNTGAKIRTHAVLNALKSAYAVHYVGFQQPDLTPAQAEAALKGCASVFLRPEPACGLTGKGWLAMRSLPDARPATMLKYTSAALAGRVREILAAHPEAVVHADHLHMAAYLGTGRSALRVVDEHNVEAQIVERAAERLRPGGALARLAAPATQAWLTMQAGRMRRYEASWLDKADLALAVSPGDAEQLAAMAPGTAVEVIPNGVDVEYFKAGETGQGPTAGRMVFTGSMNWLPNQDAMLYFCQEMLPLMRSMPGPAAGWSLDIVGQSPSAAVQALARAGVRVTGTVDDVRPYVAGGEVFIVPLRIGGGSRLKILEAFAMEVPVVSTAIGCEGLGVSDGAQLLVADTPQAFAEAVGRVASDGELRRRLVESAKRHVLERFTWPEIGRRLLSIYELRLKSGGDGSNARVAVSGSAI